MGPYLDTPSIYLPRPLPLLSLRLKGIGTEGAQRGMPTVTMIKHLKILNGGGFRRGVRVRRVIGEAFAFETAEHAFDHGIVPTISSPTHATLHLMALQQGVIGLAGVLTAPIGVVQQPRRGLPTTNGHHQRGFHQRGLHRSGHSPLDDLAGKQIHDDRQIQPALLGGEIRDVTAPHAIGHGHGKLPIQEIGRDR